MTKDLLTYNEQVHLLGALACLNEVRDGVMGRAEGLKQEFPTTDATRKIEALEELAVEIDEAIERLPKF